MSVNDNIYNYDEINYENEKFIVLEIDSQVLSPDGKTLIVFDEIDREKILDEKYKWTKRIKYIDAKLETYSFYLHNFIMSDTIPTLNLNEPELYLVF